MSADLIHAAVMARLATAPDKPQGLTLKAHPMVDLEQGELPFVGVFLGEGERPQEDSRTCDIRIEIWAKGEDPLAATRPLREWILQTIPERDTLGGLVLGIEYRGFQADGAVLDTWIGLAVLDFTFTYFPEVLP